MLVLSSNEKYRSPQATFDLLFVKLARLSSVDFCQQWSVWEKVVSKVVEDPDDSCDAGETTHATGESDGDDEEEDADPNSDSETVLDLAEAVEMYDVVNGMEKKSDSGCEAVSKIAFPELSSSGTAQTTVHSTIQSIVEPSPVRAQSVQLAHAPKFAPPAVEQVSESDCASEMRQVDVQ